MKIVLKAKFLELEKYKNNNQTKMEKIISEFSHLEKSEK